METNTNTPEAKQPASAGCHPTTCCGSSDTPETDAAMDADDRGSGWYRAQTLSNLCLKLERERDEARKKLSYKCQTVTIAEGTIQELRHRIKSLEADNLIYSTQRKKDLESNRRFAEAVTLLHNGGDGPETVVRLREIILHNADVEAPNL